MNDLRESHFIIKSDTFNPELTKLKFHLKLNFGSNEYEANLNKIKELGVEPSENVFVLSSEFNNEEAAQTAVTKISGIYENLFPTLGIPPVWETPKAQGKVFVATFRAPEAVAGQLAMVEPMVNSLGEIASSDQYFEFELSTYSPIKEIISGGDNVPEADLKNGVLVKFALVTHKELPTKVAALLSSMGAEDSNLKLGSEILASIKHIRFDIGFSSHGPPNKEAMKNEVLGWIQTAFMALTPLDLLDVVKTMGGTMKGTMCISPVVSIDLTIFCPEIIEALNIVELPNP